MREGEKKWSLLIIKTLISSWESQFHDLINPNQLPEDAPLNTITLVGSVLMSEFWEGYETFSPQQLLNVSSVLGALGEVLDIQIY